MNLVDVLGLPGKADVCLNQPLLSDQHSSQLFH